MKTVLAASIALFAFTGFATAEGTPDFKTTTAPQQQAMSPSIDYTRTRSIDSTSNVSNSSANSSNTDTYSSAYEKFRWDNRR